jgi:hypothetical protein
MLIKTKLNVKMTNKCTPCLFGKLPKRATIKQEIDKIFINNNEIGNFKNLYIDINKQAEITCRTT